MDDSARTLLRAGCYQRLYALRDVAATATNSIPGPNTRRPAIHHHDWQFVRYHILLNSAVTGWRFSPR